MDETFRAKLDAGLAEYRAWKGCRRLRGCRLVQYCGAEHVGSKSLPVHEAEGEISGGICEGFYVDWTEHRDIGYLRVWERPGPEPEWPDVFAETPRLNAMGK